MSCTTLPSCPVSLAAASRYTLETMKKSGPWGGRIVCLIAGTVVARAKLNINEQCIAGGATS
jgi:hypothetical protein